MMLRAVTRDAAWTGARVAQIYDRVRDADGEAPFGDVVYRYCLDAWGAPSLADRAAHDLYYNVRRHAPTSRRCLLFAAFSGIDNDPVSKMGHRVGSSRLLFEAATAPGGAALLLPLRGLAAGRRAGVPVGRRGAVARSESRGRGRGPRRVS